MTLRVAGDVAADQDTVEVLKDWLKRAEAGEITGFFGVAHLRGSDMESAFVGSSTVNEILLAVERIKLRILLRELTESGELDRL